MTREEKNESINQSINQCRGVGSRHVGEQMMIMRSDLE